MGIVLILLLIAIVNSYGLHINSKTIEGKNRQGKKKVILNIRTDLNDIAPEKTLRYIPSKKQKPSKFGIPVIGSQINTSISLKDMECFENVCIIKINLEGAKGGKIHFLNLSVHKDEYILVRSGDGKVFYKYGESRNGSKLWSGVVPGNLIFIEYHFKDGKPKGSFFVDKVMYIWDLPFFKQNKGLPNPGGNPPCNAQDASCCPDQQCYQLFKDAVAVYTFTGSDGLEYICTGTLVANQSFNHDPIFLTARHCISTPEEAKSANFWFKYYDSGCKTEDAENNAILVSEATLIYSYNSGDTSLLRIDGSLRIDINNYFLAGVLFNEKPALGSEVFGFSHPVGFPLVYHAGVLEGLCKSDFFAYTTVCGVSDYNSFHVVWKEGGTAEGSSGSCLFYKLGNEWYCIGTLSFGEQPTPQCPPLNDYYADLSDFYNSNNIVREIFKSGLPDDKYEENDSLQSPYKINMACNQTESFPALVVKDLDPDFFYISLPKGCIAEINASFNHAWGDIDLFLYDSVGNLISSSETVNDFERLTYTFKDQGGIVLNVELMDDTYQEYLLEIITYNENEAPVCQVIINGDARYTNSTAVTLDIKVQDNVYDPTEIDICVYEEGKPCSSWQAFQSPYIFNVSAKDGTKIVNVAVRDPVGNIGNCQDSIELDITPPSGGTISVARTGIRTISISWSNFSDNISGLDHYILVYDTSSIPASCDEGNILYKGGDTSFIHNNINPGNTYHYRICAVDVAGNVSKGVLASITVENDPPIINSFIAQPTEGLMPLKVKFSWDIYDKENDQIKCEIDIGDNGLIDATINPCNYQGSYSFTFDNPGDYPVKLIVTDSAKNRVEALTTVKVFAPSPVNKPPFISYFDVYPTEGVAPLEVRVGYSVGDPDGDPLKCEIDFDSDGTPEFETEGCKVGNATFLYEEEGSYTLIFKVIDSMGNAESREVLISVLGKQEPVREEEEENIVENLFGCTNTGSFMAVLLIFMGILVFKRLKLII